MSAKILHGDSRALVPTLGENTIDAVVTDPPYALVSVVKRFGSETAAAAKSNGATGVYARASAGFMGKTWDTGEVAFDPGFWVEVLRVLKPGGHVLAFGGTRTYHRLACAIEDAGFEIRDQIGWLYGCLDEATEVATPTGTAPYHKTKTGDLVLCYDPATGEYSYQPVLEVVVYDYADTAYRLVGDHGEQVVSRNHRCIVERGGREGFVLAEEAARERDACVPFLESLPDLRAALHDLHERAGCSEPNLRAGMHQDSDQDRELRGEGSIGAEGARADLRGVRRAVLAAGSVDQARLNSGVQSEVQRSLSRAGVEEVCGDGTGALGRGCEGVVLRQDDRPREPVMERRADVQEPKGRIREPADQVRSLSAGSSVDGTAGRIRDGASAGGGESDRATIGASGGGASRQSRRDGQSAGELDAVRDERTAQGVRAWRGHRSSMVRIVPFHYVGKVWCLRVPTGAFVAVRNGVAFPTGNSGFPKSLDVSKAIDKAAGAEREVLSEGAPVKRMIPDADQDATGSWVKDNGRLFVPTVTAPATDAARQWDGWGTALKPAWEPIVVARKPLVGTVAENVTTWGTGAINIDGCRVPSEGGRYREDEPSQDRRYDDRGATNFAVKPGPRGGDPSGRFPANVIHDGSDEVMEAFPQAPGQQGDLRRHDRDRQSPNGVFGKMGPARDHAKRNDSGTAARFFYAAKASKTDRAGSKHPTVKPLALMRYLCRLVTPPGGVILDPFAGSGTTLQAAIEEGFRAILIEREVEYVADIRRRLGTADDVERAYAEKTGIFA